ncbi:MAG: TonB-dependent receptor [Caldiserica bacterium]|nr:TonB-dependent receptor [Caldisericota bacterium]
MTELIIHENLFFEVNDTKITPSDISKNELESTFKSIRYKNPTVNSASSVNILDITEDFKPTIIEDQKNNNSEELGTFYSEENTTDSSETFIEKEKKIYFGPAKSFNFTLSGIVRDKSTGEALPFANIQIKESTIGTATNTDGYFTLLKVPTDTSTLLVSNIGYSVKEVFLTPQSSKKAFTIELSPASLTLKTVNVTAKKEDVVLINKTEVNTVKMTPKKLEQLPNMGEKDVMRSLQLMPGISASNESSSGLYVRGGTPDQNLVLYDGFTVYQVDHLYGFFSAFNSNAIKDVQLYKGGFESRFGGRLSSVTEITGKDGNQKKFNMGADISMLSVNGFVEIPIGKKLCLAMVLMRFPTQKIPVLATQCRNKAMLAGMMLKQEILCNQNSE